MKILYFGSLCDQEVYARKLTHREPFFQAQYSYEHALCQELAAADGVDMEFVTIYQTSYFPKDRFFCRKSRKAGTPFKMLGFINLPFLREASYFLSAAREVGRWAWRTRKTKDRCVYTSTHFTPVSLAIVLTTRLLRIKRVVTFTDLSLYTFQESRIREMPAYKRAVIAPYVRLTEKLQQSYDGYVLFTEAMKDVVDPDGRPYCVVEGIYNGSGIDLAPVEKKDAIAHAGTLNRQVGIGNILEAHRALDLPTELWLMGDGDMKEAILARCAEDDRVKYLGFMPRPEVFERLKAARLLVILRDPADEYTKYSFPSKMFEYMVSGTPVFTTCLRGVPPEYYPHIYTTDASAPDEAAARLRDILQRPEDELREKGRLARAFVLEQKNAKVQSGKIKRFLETLLAG